MSWVGASAVIGCANTFYRHARSVSEFYKIPEIALCLHGVGKLRLESERNNTVQRNDAALKCKSWLGLLGLVSRTPFLSARLRTASAEAGPRNLSYAMS